MSTSVSGLAARHSAQISRAARVPKPASMQESPGVRCASCAREVVAGAVRSRGSTFCSIECALSATLPGVYLG
jgi:hypothetical protein